MIDLFTWSTPNGYKISIALEELGLPYEVHPVDIGRGEQFAPEFLAISPNNRIPAIIDRDGPGGRPLSLFESGAILLYLADKTGKLISADPAQRWAATEWLAFQIAGIGPMFGQLGHFRRYAKEKLPYAIERYTNEVNRLSRVLDGRLAKVEYLAGDYSIADIAVYPWVRRPEAYGLDYSTLPNLSRWLTAISARPAVQRGLQIPPRTDRPLDDKAHEILFGSKQYQPR
jgi:GST-like protein